MPRESHFTARKVEVLDLIHVASIRHARPPSVRELAEHFNVSSATMHSWLTRLSNEGLVEWQQGRHRSLRCTQEASRLLTS